VATGEKNCVIAGALETETARNWMCFNEVYREVFGVLTIHIYAFCDRSPNDEKLSGVVL
jgi:hypothetical protein